MKKSMTFKFVILITAAIIYTVSSSAQGFNELDEAPHDIAYYRTSKATTPLVKVIYGRPSVKKTEKVFGEKVPFNELWRTGANEATEIKIYKDVMFGDRLVHAGTYVLYTIPGEDQWEVILSSNTDVVGMFQYDPIFDVARIKVKVAKGERLNTFSLGFTKKENNTVQMVFAWGSTRVKVPLDFNEPTLYAGHYKRDKKIKG